MAEQMSRAAEFREARQALDLTQVQFAKALGLTSRQVQRLEAGDTAVSKSLWLAVAYLIEHTLT